MEIAAMFGWLAKNNRPAPKGYSLYQGERGLGHAPVLITLLGADLQLVARAVKRHARARSYLPVFVMSEVGHAPLLAAGAIVEYLPSVGVVSRFADAGNWELYLAERWRLLIAKWRPAYSARYGASFDEYLDSCRNHARLTPSENSAANRTGVPS